MTSSGIRVDRHEGSFVEVDGETGCEGEFVEDSFEGSRGVERGMGYD